MDILELGDPNAPYGLKGVGEPPAISSGPAIVAAIRAASGRNLTRVPVRPHDIGGS
jgi:CO/xanthine dehydrogenase Mo-binding subunit